MINKLELNIEIIIKEYGNYVFKIVDNTVKNSLSYQDKEEIVSDTFFLLWKNQDKIDHNLKSYLAAIAKNCSYQRLNKAREDIQFDEDINGFKDDVENIIYVEQLLKRLTREEIKVFKLYYVNGYKIKEISKMTDKSSTNVKVILYRIRKKLREGKKDV
ncbi:MAG: RNA polymerase sigma factor [Bacilli bacterium]|nr:RNA polymerase sigma factor [Bacilli bacterium]